MAGLTGHGHPGPFQKISKQFLKKLKIENIQFPTSHLEAENPFGLVALGFYDSLERLEGKTGEAPFF